jgi:hypothetical protein
VATLLIDTSARGIRTLRKRQASWSPATGVIANEAALPLGAWPPLRALVQAYVVV